MHLSDRSGRDCELYISLMDKYDATRLHLGESMKDANASFGEATSIARDAQETILTYGHGISGSSFAAPFVSVGLANDVVVWIETRYGGPRPDAPPRRTYEWRR